jgi:hypothetical protein
MPDTALPAVTERQQVLVPATPNMLFDPDAFAHGQRVANLFASSQLVPQHLRGKVADCFIALHMAERLKEDPLIVMQNIVIVSGKAGWMTQYMIGRANRSGVFKGRINWRTTGAGDKLEVTAFATLADTGDEVSATTSMAMAKAEGWTSNKKYQSMPEHMLRWRSATMLIRLFCPEVMLGIPAADELEDVQAGQMRDVTPARPTRASTRRIMEAEAGDPTPAAATVEAAPEPAQEAEAEPQPAIEDVSQEAEATPAFVLITCDGEEMIWEDPADAKSVFDELQAQIKDATGRGAASLAGLLDSNDALVATLREAGYQVATPEPSAAPKKVADKPTKAPAQDALDIPPHLDRRSELKPGNQKPPF